MMRTFVLNGVNIRNYKNVQNPCKLDITKILNRGIQLFIKSFKFIFTKSSKFTETYHFHLFGREPVSCNIDDVI